MPEQHYFSGDIYDQPKYQTDVSLTYNEVRPVSQRPLLTPRLLQEHHQINPIRKNNAGNISSHLE